MNYLTPGVFIPNPLADAVQQVGVQLLLPLGDSGQVPLQGKAVQQRGPNVSCTAKLKLRLNRIKCLILNI